MKYTILIFLALFFTTCSDKDDDIFIPDELEFQTFYDMPIENPEFQSGSIRSSGSLAYDHQTNQLFFVCKYVDLKFGSLHSNNLERVIGLNDQGEVLFDSLTIIGSQFRSKVTIIDGDELVVVGAETINRYAKNDGRNLSVKRYGNRPNMFVLLRHGAALANDDIFVWGGYQEYVEDRPGDHLWYVDKNDSLVFYMNLPVSRYRARGVFNNQRLFIAGGTDDWTRLEGQSSVLVLDIETKDYEWIDLPVPVSETYTDQVNGLIYIGGYNPASAFSTENRVYDNHLLVLDTSNDEIKEIDISSIGLEEKDWIMAIALGDHDLFVLVWKGVAEKAIIYKASLS